MIVVIVEIFTAFYVEMSMEKGRDEESLFPVLASYFKPPPPRNLPLNFEGNEARLLYF